MISAGGEQILLRPDLVRQREEVERHTIGKEATMAVFAPLRFELDQFKSSGDWDPRDKVWQDHRRMARLVLSEVKAMIFLRKDER